MVALNPEIGDRLAMPDESEPSKNIRVLIADHDEALLAAYREFLEAQGFRVRTARGAVEFLTKLRRWLPDVVVLEPYLPHGSSRRLLHALRRCADLPPIPTLIHGCRSDAPACLEFPICGYEARPLRREQLAGRVREVLRRFTTLSVERRPSEERVANQM